MAAEAIDGAIHIRGKNSRSKVLHHVTQYILITIQLGINNTLQYHRMQ